MNDALFDLAGQLGCSQFSRKGAWFRINGTRGNARGLTGQDGRLMWIGIEGNPNALSSSPDSLRVTRVGLAVEGRTGLVFLAPHHVVPVSEVALFNERAGATEQALWSQAEDGDAQAGAVLADRLFEMGLTELATQWRAA